jgi:hypothetical protein
MSVRLEEPKSIADRTWDAAPLVDSRPIARAVGPGTPIIIAGSIIGFIAGLAMWWTRALTGASCA